MIVSASLLVTALSLAFAPTGAAAAEKPLEPEIAQALREAEIRLREDFEASGVPGMAVAVVIDQDIVFSTGFGRVSLSSDEPASPDTVFRVGSITKLFTANVLMRMRDAGLVALDDPVAAALPIPIENPFGAPQDVTFRQLASHTSGFPPEGGDYWRTQNFPTIDDLYASLGSITLESEPFTSVRYSNFAVSVLGDTLSRLSDRPYVELVAEDVFRPLGMSNSAFNIEDLPEGSIIAAGHTDSPEGLIEAAHISLGALAPAGQAYSTANDLAAFVSAQFDAADGDRRLGLKPPSAREMWQPEFLFPDFADSPPMGFAIGLGWFVREVSDRHAIGHAGGVPGYTSDVTAIPSLKLGVVVLTNGSSDPVRMSRNVLEVVAPAIVAANLRERLKGADYRPEWFAYVGRYDMAGVIELVVEHRDDRLVFVHPMGDPDEPSIMVPTGPHDFDLVGGYAGGESLKFEVDDTGAVLGLNIVGIPAAKK